MCRMFSQMMQHKATRCAATSGEQEPSVKIGPHWQAPHKILACSYQTRPGSASAHHRPKDNTCWLATAWGLQNLTHCAHVQGVWLPNPWLVRV